MKKKKRTKRAASNDLLSSIEELVGEAYEIGYDHGGNPFRMSRGELPYNIDKGWGPIAKKLHRLFKRHLGRTVKGNR